MNQEDNKMLTLSYSPNTARSIDDYLFEEHNRLRVMEVGKKVKLSKDKPDPIDITDPKGLCHFIDLTVKDKDTKIRLKRSVKTAEREYTKKLKRNPGKEKLEEIRKELLRQLLVVFLMCVPD